MTATLGKIIADFNTTLNLKVVVGATSATLDSATDDDGVALPTGTYFLTFDGNSKTSKEYIKCTLTGTALTSIQSVSRQGALTSGFARPHRKGATVTITDFAIIKKMLDLLDGTTDFNASVPLKYDGTATISNANELATKAYVDGVAIAGGADASTTVKGITKMSVAPASATSPIAVGDNDGRVPTQDENDALAGTSGTSPSSSNKFVDNADTTGTGNVVRLSVTNAIKKFGGTGADGALNVTSGTTTIDLASANLVIKNYSSINVSAGATLAFSNPAADGTVIELLSTGNVTIAGTVTLTNLGASADTAGYTIGITSAVAAVTSATPTGSGQIANTTATPLTILSKNLYTKQIVLGAAGGGAGGTAGASAAGGAGGRGAGTLYIECAGALSVTGTINGNGTAGTAGTASANGSGGGGGGGGGGGTVIILYTTLTVNSGTYNVTGGAGGSGGNAGGGSGGSGAAGGSGGATGYYGGGGGRVFTTNGNTGNNGANGGGPNGGSFGTPGSAATASGGSCGGGGGSGVSIVALNSFFA